MIFAVTMISFVSFDTSIPYSLTGMLSRQSKKVGINSTVGYQKNNLHDKKKKKKNLGYFICYPETIRKSHSWSQSGLDCVTPGGRTRCSSILLDWERRMRLKKSSSGTVGPLFADGGAAHL